LASPRSFLTGLLALALALTCVNRAQAEAKLLIEAATGKVDRKSTRLNSSHTMQSRMPSSA